MSKFLNWIKNKDAILYESISQDEFGTENNEGKLELVVLIGPPAIGKSTYIAQKFAPQNVFVVNRDDIVNEVSSSMSMTYDDMFAYPPPDASLNASVQGMEQYGVVKEAPKYMRWTKYVYDKIQNANDRINEILKQKFKEAIDSGKNVVVDMTNMTYDSRKNCLNYVKNKDYFKRAVVFTMQDSDLTTLFNRMRSRSEKIKSQGGSKTIGEDIVNRMISSFQKVNPDEGFDKVDTINSFSI
jgi:predicted kinase